MDKGCEGGQLHGNFDNAPYFYREGKIFTGLIVVEYLLADEGPGDGGICVVPGSHKVLRLQPSLSTVLRHVLRMSLFLTRVAPMLSLCLFRCT